MTDLLSQVPGSPFEAPEESALEKYANTAPSTIEKIGAALGEGPTSPTAKFSFSRYLMNSQYDDSFWGSVGRGLMQGMFNEGALGPGMEAPDFTSLKKAPIVPADEVNERFGPVGPDGKKEKITDKPLPEPVAQRMGEARAAQIEREGIFRRYEANHGWLVNRATDMAAMLDPLNMASMVVPGLGEEAILGQLARVGIQGSLAARTLARVGAGSTAGAAGMVPVAALQWGLAANEGADFGIRDFMSDVLMGGALGGIIHGGIVGPYRELRYRWSGKKIGPGFPKPPEEPPPPSGGADEGAPPAAAEGEAPASERPAGKGEGFRPADVDVFYSDIGPKWEAQLADLGFTRESAPTLFEHYERRPGETHREALERAVEDHIDRQTREQLGEEDAGLASTIEREVQRGTGDADVLWQALMSDVERGLARNSVGIYDAGAGMQTFKRGWYEAYAPADSGAGVDLSSPFATHVGWLLENPKYDAPFSERLRARSEAAWEWLQQHMNLTDEEAAKLQWPDFTKMGLGESPATRHAAQSVAVSQLLEGAPVNVLPIVESRTGRDVPLGASEVAAKERQQQRNGFAQGMPQGEFDAAREAMFPEKVNEGTKGKESARDRGGAGKAGGGVSREGATVPKGGGATKAGGGGEPNVRGEGERAGGAERGGAGSEIRSLRMAELELARELIGLPFDSAAVPARTIEKIQRIMDVVARLGGDFETVLRNAFKQVFESASKAEGLVQFGAADAETTTRNAMERVRELLGGAPKTERTEQGEQTLLPGVNPITDRERAQMGMEKPLRGGEARPPEGGLFDEGARSQQDMFAQVEKADPDLALALKALEGKEIHPEDAAEIERATKAVADAELREDAYQQAATCIIEGEG